MSRFTNDRVQLYAHDKKAFKHPFSCFVGLGGCMYHRMERAWNCDSCDMLPETQSVAESIVYNDMAKALIGNWPKNIASWIMSVPGGGSHNKKWILLNRLTNGAYVLYIGHCLFDGYENHLTMHDLHVGKTIADIVLKMSGAEYNHYIDKTVPRSLVMLMPNLVKADFDPEPWGPVNEDGISVYDSAAITQEKNYQAAGF